MNREELAAGWGWAAKVAVGLLVVVLDLALGASPARASDLLDPVAWKSLPADGVSLAISADREPSGAPALRLEYDFHGRAGWAAARRALELELPERWEVRFDVRGDGPSNHLEVKLVDARENVYWYVFRNVAWPHTAEPWRVRERQVSFAWGPDSASPPPLRRLAQLELTVTAASGGKGTVWISELGVVPREKASPTPPRLAVTGLPTDSTGARPDVLDLGGLTEVGALSIRWIPGRAPGRVALETSEDGKTFHLVREAEPRGAPRTDFFLPETEARVLRLLMRDPGPEGFGLIVPSVRPLSVGASRNAFVSMLAAEAPRGAYPRAFLGEQSYWTVVGVDKDPVEMLVSEDGAIEMAERYTLEPFVRLESSSGAPSRLITWADARIDQSLAEGDLPIPTVAWSFPAETPALRLSITALAAPVQTGSALLARYRLENRSDERRTGTLYLAARPFQVNPPQQFLNDPGGTSRLSHLFGDGHAVEIEGEPSLFTSPSAKFGALTFDEGNPVERLADASTTFPARSQVVDPEGQATGLLAWPFVLAPGDALEVVAAGGSNPASRPAAAELAAGGPQRFAALEAEVAAAWSRRLGRVRLDLPPSAEPIARTVRSSLAWVLVHRDGPAFQPGSRAYARSWIRDGALTGVALLRLGEIDAVREFVDWFSGYVSPDGTVSCCVDRRGADSVPEHDSHGELIHLIAEVYRYGRHDHPVENRAWGERMLPLVGRVVDHLEALRQSRRTEAWRGAQDGRNGVAAYGLLPESISHEGYSAKAVHSYWDDFFAYRGLDDAVDLARSLGRPDLAATWGTRRDEFRTDLLASIEKTRARAGIAYVPGSADLADFDSTATTIALDPAGLEGRLPKTALDATFETFWRDLAARRSGEKPWEVYTPYEIRHVGAFLRLGWKERALSALDFYLGDRRPLAWNQWPEVVSRDPRAARFVGDLPHGWVATDFVRSALDLFAYERRSDEALVLGAGIPASWLDPTPGRPGGLGVAEMRTPWGALSYRLTRQGEAVRYEISGEGLEIPPGGLVLTWPLEGRTGEARVDGAPAAIAGDGTVTVRRVPTTVELRPSRRGLDVDRKP